MSCPPPRFDVLSTERSRVTQSPRGHSSPLPGSVEDLERIIADLLPTGIPTDLMSRRGKEAQRIWGELAASPLYEALTIWVMAAWPEQTLDRVDTMVRTAIAAGHQVREGRWSTTAADRRRPQGRPSPGASGGAPTPRPSGQPRQL